MHVCAPGATKTSLWVLPRWYFADKYQICTFKRISLPNVAVTKNPMLQKHFSHASCSELTGAHQALPLGFPLTVRPQGLSNPSSWLPTRLGFQRLPFANHLVTAWSSCGGRAGAAFQHLQRNAKEIPDAPPSPRRSPIAEEVPESTKHVWIQQNCKPTVRIISPPPPCPKLQISGYILPCGSCWCTAACVQLSTARNTIKSSNCSYARSRKSC